MSSKQVGVAPHVAALSLEKHFKVEAFKLRPEDWALQEDLAQEMALAVLECAGPQPISYFKEFARTRAVEYLLKWDEASRVPTEFGVVRRTNELDCMTDDDQMRCAQESHQLEESKVDSFFEHRNALGRAA
jgi:hypothetical protein